MMSLLPILLALTAGGCHPLSADKILGHDLAAADSSFASLQPDASFGFAPIPGHERRYTRGELSRIATANGISSDLPETLCFAWETALPAKSELAEAMHRALMERDVTIEVLEQSLEPAPNGEIVFPVSNLPVSAEGPVMWRGYVRYAGERHFWIWARVRLTVREQRLISTEAIRPGELIRADQIRIANFEGAFTKLDYPKDPAAVVGMEARTFYAPETFIRNNTVEPPKEVERGDRVQVTVQMANARIQAEGIAEGSGRKGNLISVRNAKSGRSFLAQIQEKGKVVVNPASSGSLVAGEKGW